MTTRRRVLLPATFITAAVCLVNLSAVRGQTQRVLPPGQHVPLAGSLTPDQVKQALERLGKSGEMPGGLPFDPAQLAELFKNARGGPADIDPKVRDRLLEQLKANPELLRQIQKAAEKQRADGRPPAVPDDLKDWLKNLQPRKDDPAAPPVPARPPAGGNEVRPPFNPGDALQPTPKQKDQPFRDREGPPFPGDPLPLPDMGRAVAPPLPPSHLTDFAETPQERSRRAMAAAWEQTVGPLDETPAVRQALFELIEGTGDLKGPDGNSFWDTLSKQNGDGTGLGDLLGDSPGDGWKLPKFDLPSFEWGRSSPDLPRPTTDSSGGSWWSRRGSSSRSGGGASGGSSGGSGAGGFGIPGFEGSWASVIVLAVLLLGALAVWRFWYLRDPEAVGTTSTGALGPWPVDPRRLTTRRDVVRAFEYLSVLICGPSAKTWTHHTIAAALADIAVSQGETAVLLARLYELAKYTPTDEALTTADLAEARRIVCRLAGLGDE